MSIDKRKINLEEITRFITVGLGLSWVELIGETWKLSRKLIKGHASEGTYDVLAYATALEIQDDEGKSATVTKWIKVRYSQNNMIAFQDQAWGDGEILLD